MSRISERIFRNTLFNTFGSTYTTISQLIIIPYIIVKLGPERFGVWALVAVISGLFSALDFGTGTAFVKYFSEYFTKRDYESFNRVLVAGFTFMFIFSSFLILLVFLLNDKMVTFFNIPTYLKRETTYVFLGAAIIFGFNNAFGIFQAIIKGLQRMEITNTINIIGTTIYIIGVIIVLNSGFGLKGLIINQGIKIFIICTTSIYYSKKIFPKVAFRCSSCIINTI